MRRRRVTRREDGITLFPFLAVLICTMGSLIVLLVIVVQQAKANAANVSEQRESQRQNLSRQLEELREQKEEFEWRINVLETSRSQTAEQLQDRRRELSHLEHEIEEISRELDRAVAEAERIAQRENDQVADQEASRQEAEELRDALRRAKADLELARQDLANRQRSYSIVPYTGPHGTQRRPVFIECLNDKIILQPEGIELTSRDFREPLTDENPLAAALRAKREYLARTLQSDSEPYPLLVVRPDGAASYAAARAAMKSWDAEFGYELVESDLQLNYPNKDPLLTKALEHTVREARARRRHLQAIAPARFGRQGSTTLTASRSGGFVRQGGGEPGGGRLAGGNYGTSPYGSPDGSFSGRANRPTGSDLGPQPPANLANVGRSPQDTGPQGTGGEPAAGLGQDGFRQAGRGDGFAAGSASGNYQGAGDPYDPNSAQRGGGDDSADQLSINRPANPNGNPSGGSSGWESQPSGPAANNAAQAGGSRSATSARDGASSASVSRGSSGASSQPSGQGPSGIGGVSSGLAPPTAIAQSRGTEWGLPERSGGATGITRPIQLIVSQNRLEVLPEDRRLGKSIRFPIEGSMRDEIDQLVPAIWKRMDGWGIAGAGMYWKPILSVQVRPGAEARYQELTALMKNSGLVVQRKQN